MKRITLISTVTALFLASILFLHCTNEQLTSTDVVNEKVITIYLADGMTPAPNTTVRFYAVGDTSKLYKYQTVTNVKGQYSLEGVKDLNGVYNVWNQLNDTLMAYQDSVIITPNAYTVKDDTLQKTGTLSAIVGLQPNDDPRTVTVQVLGTHKFSNVDSAAHFTLSGMAAGEYSLKISTTLPQYTSIYPDIKIQSGINDTVKDTFKLIHTGIPVVTGIKISYDTLNGQVALSWNKVNYQNLQDYLVYRAYIDSILWPITPLTSVPDTVLIDSVFKKSIPLGPFSFSDTNNYHFKYRVCARNNSDQIGLTYKYVDINAPSPTLVRTFFSWKYLNTIADSTSINDTVTIIAGYKNATRKNMKLSWYIISKDSLFLTVNDSSLTGNDTIKYAWPVASRPKIYVSMVDQGNTIWWDNTILKIVQDMPVADAGNDTTVTINSPVTLTGTYTQQFGVIVMYKWDFNGDSIYDDSSAITPTMSHTYTHEAAYDAKFYVRDDDGNEATDMRKVTVLNSYPVITSIRPDTTISIKDSIALRATAIDNDGTIKEYAWDFEGDGVFEYTSATQINTGYKYDIAGIYNAIIRVTDDVDQVTKDTAQVTVLQDVPVADAGKDTTVSINDLIRLHGSAKDSFGVIIKWEWDFGNTGTFIQTSTSDTSITAASSESLNYQCVLRVTDDDVYEAKDTIKISVLQDVPVADAGVDTIVSINDFVHLHGSATQQFGTIAEWAWDIGNNGTFKVTSTGDTIIIAPVAENLNWLCVLRVTDDDGNVAKDTVKVEARKDTPIADAGKDTVIRSNYQYTLRGKATQQFGSIVKWEWNINGAGFKVTSSGDTTITTPDLSVKLLICILRITDDDGNSGIDTVNLTLRGIWDPVGEKGFADGISDVQSLAIYNCTPYIAFQDGANGNKTTVMRYNGSAWESVGERGFSDGVATFQSLTIYGGTPYVAFQDGANGNKTTVMRYNGNAWEPVGAKGFSDEAAAQSLQLYNGTPYVAFLNLKNGRRVTVMRYYDSTWVLLGANTISDYSGGGPSLQIYNGTPYVSFQDGRWEDQITVLRYSGSVWEPVGQKKFCYGYTRGQCLAVYNGTCYVAHRELSTSQKDATVSRYNGSAWEYIGVKGFSDKDAYNICIAIYNDTPYVGFQDGAKGNRTTVMRYNGSLWESVGEKGFSDGFADMQSIQICNGTPYIAFLEVTKGNRITVMRFW